MPGRYMPPEGCVKRYSAPTHQFSVRQSIQRELDLVRRRGLDAPYLGISKSSVFDPDLTSTCSDRNSVSGFSAPPSPVSPPIPSFTVCLPTRAPGFCWVYFSSY